MHNACGIFWLSVSFILKGYSSELLPSHPFYLPLSVPSPPFRFFRFSKISPLFLFSSNDPFCRIRVLRLGIFGSALPPRHVHSPCLDSCWCCFSVFVTGSHSVAQAILKVALAILCPPLPKFCNYRCVTLFSTMFFIVVASVLIRYYSFA